MNGRDSKGRFLPIQDEFSNLPINLRFYHRHKEEIRKKYDKDYYKKYYAKNAQSLEKYRLELRIQVIEKLGGKCANPFNFPHPDWCNDWRCLQIDHVNGGGHKEHNKYKSGTSFLKKVLADTKGDYQLLCANCNWIKRFEKGE
jgi:hypothetical protein